MLPPYAKSIPPGSRDIVIVSGLDSWKIARNMHAVRPCLCLPPSAFPEQYTWPVQNAEVTICDDGSSIETLERLAYSLLRAGASLVCVLYGYSLSRFYRDLA